MQLLLDAVVEVPAVPEGWGDDFSSLDGSHQFVAIIQRRHRLQTCRLTVIKYHQVFGCRNSVYTSLYTVNRPWTGSEAGASSPWVPLGVLNGWG